MVVVPGPAQKQFLLFYVIYAVHKRHSKGEPSLFSLKPIYMISPGTVCARACTCAYLLTWNPAYVHTCTRADLPTCRFFTVACACALGKYFGSIANSAHRGLAGHHHKWRLPAALQIWCLFGGVACLAGLHSLPLAGFAPQGGLVAASQGGDTRL